MYYPEFMESFDNEWPHPCGDVPIRLDKEIQSDGSGEMTWAVHAHSSYTPEPRICGRTFTIVRGSGMISLDGVISSYESGSVFEINPNVPVGLISVHINTVVQQTNWPSVETLKTRAMLQKAVEQIVQKRLH